MKSLTSRLVAHRGDMLHQPENSWRSLLAAIQCGARWLEFDVQMCTDGTLVLLHDDTLLRTAAVDLSVFDTNWKTLADVSIHYPDQFQDHFRPTPVSQLGDVLKDLARFADVRAMIEIKDESLKHFGIKPVMDTLLSELQGWKNQHLLISFNEEALDYAKHNSTMPIGWVLEKYDAQHLHKARWLNPGYLICNHTKMNPEERPSAGAWQWMVYDITDPALAMHWMNNGIELVETGDISGMISHGL